MANIVSYLEKKRLQFPRFFFISDRALLTILGQTDADSRPIHAHLSSLFAAAAAATTYSHLSSLFAGVSGLQCDDKQRDLVVSVSSSQGATLQVLVTWTCHLVTSRSGQLRGPRAFACLRSLAEIRASFGKSVTFSASYNTKFTYIYYICCI